MMFVKEYLRVSNRMNVYVIKFVRDFEILELRKVLGDKICNLEIISNFERKRDKVFV